VNFGFPTRNISVNIAKFSSLMMPLLEPITKMASNIKGTKNASSDRCTSLEKRVYVKPRRRHAR
jgi:hypothetical protein